MPPRSLAFSGASAATFDWAPPAQPMTLSAALKRWAAQVLSFVIGFAVVGGLMVLTGSAGTSMARPGEPRAWHHRSHVAELVSRHHCWRGRAPEPVIPGHAVVTLPGERPRRVRAQIGFAIWLHDKRGTVHAFCP